MLYPAYSYVPPILIPLGIILLLLSEILLFGRRFYVTNYAVSERIGMLSKRVRSVDMDDIINITVTQSVWHRMLRYGEIHINTSETEKEEEIIFPCIANPYRAKKVVEESMRRHVPARKTTEGLNYRRIK